MKRLAPIAAATVVGLLITVILADARPNRYGHSDREERHMFPAVTTGPLDPAWSPDGRWIAFSMRGDIWKVPSDGGAAIALTSGPDYHFEPAWSPDGRRLALSYDREGTLGVGVVDADGGEVEPVAPSSHVDIQPAWDPTGETLYFVSAREGPWRIFRYDPAAEADSVEAVARGIQPSVSPGGDRLAYVGGEGLRVLDLEDGESRLVRAEETAFRMKPRWTPDGRSLLYVSDQRGSNDVRIISAEEGRPVRLTADADNHQLDPAPAPDRERFAFVSNERGPTTLYTAPLGGGPPGAWEEVRITDRQARSPTGRLRIHVRGPDGEPVPSRIHLDAADGRSYAPDGGFHRAMMVFDRHYFHIRGEAEVEVPVGEVEVEAVRGFEYLPATERVEVAQGEVATVTLELRRLADMPAEGWYSGDTHLHDLHQGRFGLTHDDFFLQLVAEDIRMGWSLIHMDGTRIQGRWEDLTGAPHPVSTESHILQYGQEFRGGLGHVGMLGIHDYVLPFVAGQPGTPYAQHSLDLPYIDGTRRQGGLAGFVHPYASEPREPADAGRTLMAMNMALGRGDYYDVTALWSDALASASFYYRLLNAGFRLPATGGTDNFSDVFRDPPAGSARTYVQLDGPLSVDRWLDGVREGRTFTTTGPLLTLEADDGRGPGEVIALPDDGPESLPVEVVARSITPMDSLQVLVNGEVVETVAVDDPLEIRHRTDVSVPDGGWVAARVLGPPSIYVGDDYAFAHTSPVYVERGGSRYRSPEALRFLEATVQETWRRVEDSAWRSETERERFRAAVDEARQAYRALLEEAEP